MKLRYLFVPLLAACGGGGHGNGIPDAKTDDSMSLPGTAHRFVLSKQKIPTNNTQARDFGLDLDGDGVVDNQLGMVMATMAGQGMDTQGPTDRAIDRGTILMLAELRADALTTGVATFTTFAGANPSPAACTGAADQVCRRHLTGNASFTLAPASVRDTPLLGAITNNELVAGPGHLQLQTTLLGATPIPLTLIGARVKLRAITATTFEGVIAGAVKKTDVETRVYPQFQQSATEAIMRDCTALQSPPDCGCAAGSTGKTFANLFDTSPQDCKVTLDEVKNNSLIQSLFAPDVTIEGEAAISLGIGVSAVRASFTP